MTTKIVKSERNAKHITCQSVKKSIFCSIDVTSTRFLLLQRCILPIFVQSNVKLYAMDEERMLNEEALDLLDEAMFTSSLISDKERKKGRVNDWESVFPVSKEETERMEQLLDKAEEVAEDPTEEKYADRLSDLRDVVEWSKKRHRSWTWKLIAGALVGAGIFYYFERDHQDDIERACADLATVQAWDSTEVALNVGNITAEYHNGHYNDRLSSPKNFKMYELSTIKSHKEYQEKEAARIQTMADTASTEELKTSRLESVAKHKERAVEYQAEYDSVAAMNTAQIKAYALEKRGNSLQSEKDYGRRLHNFMIYLFILIPLYIITGYPRGYTLTKSRSRIGCLTAFRKVGFGLASFFFGTGLAMSFLPDDVVKYHYSDGHTETRTEGNVGNFLIMFLKFGLMIIGAFLFAFVASFIMTIETVLGLIRNFDWKFKPQATSGNKSEK